MAISIDYSGAIFRIIVPQADLTLISGSLYELDTDQFRQDVIALEANDKGIVFQNTHNHNSDFTVAGTTFARGIEILNSTNINALTGIANTDVYEIFFSPDTQYSVRLIGSNNNLFDLQNAILANAVTQVIPGNSAGLISGGTGTSDWTTAEKEQVRDALGIDGDKTTATGGQLQVTKDQAEIAARNTQE